MGTGLELLPAMAIGSAVGAGIGGLTGGGKGAGIGAGLGLLSGGLGGYLSGAGAASPTVAGGLVEPSSVEFAQSMAAPMSSGPTLTGLLSGQGLGGTLARGAVQGVGSAAIQGALAPPPPPAAIAAPSGPVPMMRPVPVPGQTMPTVNPAPRVTIGAPMAGGGMSRLDPRLIELLYRRGVG